MTWIGEHEISFLVDSRSYHIFVNLNVMKRVGMRESEIMPYDVRVAKGEKLQYGEVVKRNVQGTRVVASLPVSRGRPRHGLGQRVASRLRSSPLQL